MQKSADAYRTIGEVAEALKLPQHVLRFWEIRFPQVKPMKRGGNRRFYRPEDVDLLRAIRVLLYEDGYTIKGVQRILKEQGPRAIAGRVLDATLPADVESSRARPTGAARPGAPDPVAHRDPRRGSEALSKAVVDPPRPAARPAEPRQEGAAPLARPGPAPRVAAAFAAAAAPASLAGRLEAILADLAECARILAAARDGRDV